MLSLPEAGVTAGTWHRQTRCAVDQGPPTGRSAPGPRTGCSVKGANRDCVGWAVEEAAFISRLSFISPHQRLNVELLHLEKRLCNPRHLLFIPILEHLV